MLCQLCVKWNEQLSGFEIILFPLNIELVQQWRFKHPNSTAVKKNSYEIVTGI